MKKLMCLVVAVALVFVYGLAIAGPGQSQGSAPVTVVNTESNPVPVSGTVTGNVSINGTANVNVTNNESNPVPVSVVKTLPQAIQISYAENLNEPLLGPPSQVIYTVPAGFQLVIEYMELRGSMYSGEAARGGIYTTVNSNMELHSIMTPPAMYLLDGTPLSNGTITAGQMVRIYADPETDIVGQLSRTDGTGHAFIVLVINGYLQPVP